jgi:hypothetical protein
MARNTHQTGLTIEGLDELKRQFRNLGVNFPKAKIRQAARKGVKLPLKEAKKLAPKGKTGELKKGIVAREEEKWKKKKKLKKAVFQIWFDEQKNDVFRKPIPRETQGSRGGQTRIPFAYYPISVEYGFHTAPGKRTDPEHFIKNAVEKTQKPALEVVVSSLTKSIEQIANR